MSGLGRGVCVDSSGVVAPAESVVQAYGDAANRVSTCTM